MVYLSNANDLTLHSEIEEYVVDLEAFHGPLDLLLYLIDKNEIDIYDIPVAAITDQYIEHLHLTGEYRLENMGDFLIMASYLLNLKSRVLLPLRGPIQEEDDSGESEDPREELVQKLLDYRMIKQVAEYLDERECGEKKRVFFRPVQYVTEEREEIIASLSALTRAFRALQRRQTDEPAYTIPNGDIDIYDEMDQLMQILSHYRQGVIFQDLFAGLDRREQIALFIALLELVRQQQVSAQQENEFGEIKLYSQVAANYVNA
jgi:segregation and condensation protein A